MKGSGLATGADTRATERTVRGREFEGLTRDELLDAYRLMLLSRKIDDKEIQIKNQSQKLLPDQRRRTRSCSRRRGPDSEPGNDWLFPYYRDRALCLALGVTPLEMFLASVGSKDDPANAGRQMPSHWGHRRLNMPSQSSCVGRTACMQLARRGRRLPPRDAHRGRESKFDRDEIAYISIGEGGTSEGEFWESLNTAARGKLPVLYLVEDNGYAISVPVDVQTPGGDISRACRRFPRASHAPLRRHRLSRQLSHTARGGSTRARPQGSGPRACHGDAAVLALLLRRREAVQDAGEREAEARRDPLVRMRQLSADSKSSQPRTTSRASWLTSSVRSEPPPKRHCARLNQNPRRPRSMSTHPTSTQRRAGSRPNRTAGQARHDGRGYQCHAEGRDGA